MGESCFYFQYTMIISSSAHNFMLYAHLPFSTCTELNDATQWAVWERYEIDWSDVTTLQSAVAALSFVYN